MVGHVSKEYLDVICCDDINIQQKYLYTFFRKGGYSKKRSAEMVNISIKTADLWDSLYSRPNTITASAKEKDSRWKIACGREQTLLNLDVLDRAKNSSEDQRHRLTAREIDSCRASLVDLQGACTVPSRLEEDMEIFYKDHDEIPFTVNSAYGYFTWRGVDVFLGELSRIFHHALAHREYGLNLVYFGGSFYWTKSLDCFDDRPTVVPYGTAMELITALNGRKGLTISEARPYLDAIGIRSDDETVRSLMKNLGALNIHRNPDEYHCLNMNSETLNHTEFADLRERVASCPGQTVSKDELMTMFENLAGPHSPYYRELLKKEGLDRYAYIKYVMNQYGYTYNTRNQDSGWYPSVQRTRYEEYKDSNRGTIRINYSGPLHTLVPTSMEEYTAGSGDGPHPAGTDDHAEIDRLKELADAGDCESQFRLGELYQLGKGTEMSFEKAVHYYRLASDQDHGEAMYRLGSMYEYGLGVEKSKEKAYAMYKLSVSRKCEDARKKMISDIENEYRNLSVKDILP
ncbi:MAG: sel1 repeat family protein [archaeon]|nr:sel1 repeat family protein [archaeon]